MLSLYARDFCGRCGAPVRFLERCAVGIFLECPACTCTRPQTPRGEVNGLPCIAASGEIG